MKRLTPTFKITALRVTRKHSSIDAEYAPWAVMRQHSVNIPTYGGWWSIALYFEKKWQALLVAGLAALILWIPLEVER